MNRAKRKALKTALVLMQRTIAIIEQVKDDEEDCLNNMPENLASSDKYSSMEDAIDCIEDALSCAQEVVDNIQRAIQ